MLKLEIVTPEKRVLDQTVDSATIPTVNGEIGVLTNHLPLVSALKPGVLAFTIKGNTEKVAISSGFVEISDNRISVLTDAAETATEIDVNAARAEKDAAEKALAAASSAPIDDNEELIERLAAANARLAVAK